MTSRDKSSAVPQAHLLAGADVLRRIESHLDPFPTHDSSVERKSTAGAIGIAVTLSRYSTVAETVFVRIARLLKMPSRATAGMPNCRIAWAWSFLAAGLDRPGNAEQQ